MSTVTGRLSLPVLAIYIGWALVVHSVFPVLGLRQMLRDHLALLAWGSLAVAVTTISLWVSGGRSLSSGLFGDLWTLGYENPNVLAAMLQVTALAFVWRTYLYRTRIALTAVVFLGATFLAFQAGSSNYFLFWVVFVAAFAWLGSRTLAEMTGFVAAGSVLAAIVLIWSGNVYRFNGSSSGRIGLWDDALSAVFDVSPQEIFWTFWAGAQRPVVADGVGYAEVSGQFTNQRIGVDNTYLGIFIENGVIGLLLFIAAWVALLYPFRRLSRVPELRIAGATAVAFGFQSFVVSSIPSFGNVLTIAVATLLAMTAGQIAGRAQGLRGV